MMFWDFVGRQKFRIQYAFSTFAMFGWSLLIVDVIERWTALTRGEAIWLVPIAVIVLWLFGYAFTRTSFLEGEQRIVGEKFPQMMEVLKRLKRIERKLEK